MVKPDSPSYGKALKYQLIDLKNELEVWENIQLEKETEVTDHKERERHSPNKELALQELNSISSKHSWEHIAKMQGNLIAKIYRLRKKIAKLDEYGDNPQISFINCE